RVVRQRKRLLECLFSGAVELRELSARHAGGASDGEAGASDGEARAGHRGRCGICRSVRQISYQVRVFAYEADRQCGLPPSIDVQAGSECAVRLAAAYGPLVETRHFAERLASVRGSAAAPRLDAREIEAAHERFEEACTHAQSAPASV